MNSSEGTNCSGADGPWKTLCSSVVCCTWRYTPSSGELHTNCVRRVYITGLSFSCVSENLYIQATPSPSPMTSHEVTNVKIRSLSSQNVGPSTSSILPSLLVTKPTLLNNSHYSWDRLILIVSVAIAAVLLTVSVLIATTCICGCFAVRKRRKQRQRVAALQKELQEWG